MKRRFVLILLAMVLTTACAAPGAAQAQPVAAATAVVATPDPTEAPQAAILADPADGARIATDAFIITSAGGELAPEGSVYTITAAGDYTLSGALADGQIVVDAGDEDEVKLILKDAAIACSFGRSM